MIRPIALSLYYSLILCAASVSGLSCSKLHSLWSSEIGNVTIVNSTSVLSHALNITTANVSTTNRHSFCLLRGRVAYSTNDTLNFEVWLPNAEDHNGRFLAVGNGGMAGTIDTATMLSQLNSGFAVAGGDSGHLAALNNGGDGVPGVYLPYLHDRAQTSAWIHDSIAIFTPPAQQIVQKYYGVNQSMKSYYYGCSTGGAQGFALAQFYPHLFDGIVAGSPGNWYSHLALSFLWNSQHTMNASYIPAETLRVIRDAVVDQCDTLDGVEDRLIENPLQCRFNISSLACPTPPPSNTSSCLSPVQIAAIKSIYSGPKDARSGHELYPGFSFGSESEWAMQEGPLAEAFTIPILQNLVFDDLNYNASTFDWGTDVDILNQNAGTLIDEISSDLTPFSSKGGKMIVTQGWSDPYNAATWPIQHLHQLQAVMGASKVADFFSLFMVPGGGHCGAAASYPHVPASWHSLERLIAWVESDEKPQDMLSTTPADGSDRTRKLCPWPKEARFLGGDVDVWRSYVCA